MKNHEKRQIPAAKDKRDSRSKASSDKPVDIPAAESPHRQAADEDLYKGISFEIVFVLKDKQIEGTITHTLTGKKIPFSGLDQIAITQFMKGYLSRLEKSVEKMPVEEQPQQIHEFAEVQKEETRAVPRGEMRTRGFGVIPSGATQPTEILQEGQPFQLQWSFDPPAMSDMEGEQLDYRVLIWGKNLDSGQRLTIGEKKGQAVFGSSLTAHMPSEPLPPGMYRLEAKSNFDVKSAKSEWHSSCRESRLIHVI
jgi:hypothetical protein